MVMLRRVVSEANDIKPESIVAQPNCMERWFDIYLQAHGRKARENGVQPVRRKYTMR